MDSFLKDAEKVWRNIQKGKLNFFNKVYDK